MEMEESSVSVDFSEGRYRIVSALNGNDLLNKVLSVNGGPPADPPEGGTPVILWQDIKVSSQRWQLKKVAKEGSDFFYTIESCEPSKNLHVTMVMEAAGPWEGGEPVVMRAYEAGVADQKHREWKFARFDEPNVYKIVNRHSSMVIDVYDGKLEPEPHTRQSEPQMRSSWDPGDNRQYWKIEKSDL